MTATYEQWAEKYGVSMAVEWADENPHMDDMPAGSSHYSCTFTVDGQDGSLTIPFSMGPAHTDEPDIGNVLDALTSDASGFENAPTFEDWAGEYGYDTDSRKAEKTFRAVKEQSERFMRFVGKTAYDELLWEVARL